MEVDSKMPLEFTKIVRPKLLTLWPKTLEQSKSGGDLKGEKSCPVQKGYYSSVQILLLALNKNGLKGATDVEFDLPMGICVCYLRWDLNVTVDCLALIAGADVF